MSRKIKHSDHQEYLIHCFKALKSLLSAKKSKACNDVPKPHKKDIPAAYHLQQAFGLSSFEFWSLICCAGMEYDSSLAGLIREKYNISVPSISFLLGIIPGPHWDAFSPEKALRKTDLIHLEQSGLHVNSTIRLPEKVLHFLNGFNFFDPDLSAWCFPLEPAREKIPDELYAWLNGGEVVHGTLNCYGQDIEQIRAVVSSLLGNNGFAAYEIDRSILDLDAGTQEHLFKICLRDALLSRIIWFINAGTALSPTQERSLKRLSALCADSLVIAGASPIRYIHGIRHVEIKRGSVQSQVHQWESALADTPVNGSFKKILGTFSLSPSQIKKAAESIDGVRDPETARKMLWDACRKESRAAVPEFIEQIESAYSWEDLVLPEATLEHIKSISLQVKYRYQVVEEWGFGHKSTRGLGVAALFHGPSGTGKTLAAEVLSRHLALDLYKIDLSAVVSKYIGETEKNLAKVFDTATRANAILFFDEADALFGRRTEIKDAHDRYANIEVSYLLQRMENYPGLSILTTNLRDNIDDAFIRRIRFSIAFPFPDQVLRKRIWERVIPDRVPVKDIDYSKLAQLRICGGNIRNIALHSAYFAADSEEALGMEHVLKAARVEYAKLERPLTETEIKNWKTHEKQ